MSSSMSSTMEQIINSCSNLKYTEKMFFSKYIYKVILEPSIDVDVPVPSINNQSTWPSRFRFTHIQRAMSRQLAVLFKQQIVDSLIDVDYRVRVEGKTVRFYTNSDYAIQLFLNKFSKNIIEIHCPYNENHKTIIATDRKIRVREQLFDGNFKFKVTFKPTWQMREQRFPEIREWLDELGETGQRWSPNYILGRFLYSNKPHRELGWTVAVYLNDEHDLFLCRLKFHNIIKSVEEAILIKDL